MSDTLSAAQVPPPLKRKHTPGPWHLAGKGTVRFGKHGWVARVLWNNQEANARLIVAAPDLLEALKRMRAITAQHISPACEAADAAIAKAEGR